VTSALYGDKSQENGFLTGQEDQMRNRRPHKAKTPGVANAPGSGSGVPRGGVKGPFLARLDRLERESLKERCKVGIRDEPLVHVRSIFQIERPKTDSFI